MQYSNMKKYIFLTNMPTPYRTSFYNELFKQGLDLEVFYMRVTEADRSWSYDEKEMRHPFYIDNGFYMMVGRFHVHFNPKLLLKIFGREDAEIIIGGSWNDIDVLILTTLKRLGFVKNQLHFWSEANYLTIGSSNDNIFKRLLRKYVYNSSDGVQISSGRMTEITFEKWGMPGKPFIFLPNTIQEERFSVSDEDVEGRYGDRLPIFLISARLLENIKGIINFFKAIGVENIRKGEFVVAGDGPDEAAVNKYIRMNGVEEHIKLVGFCENDILVSLYKKANVLILPSYSDASPLALVEGLIMKLPLLVSERCGNHFEAVKDGTNGFLFDPFDPPTIKQAFEAIMDSRREWRSMGEASGQIYSRIFKKTTAIERFIHDLTQFSKAGTRPNAFH